QLAGLTRSGSGRLRRRSGNVAQRDHRRVWCRVGIASGIGLLWNPWRRNPKAYRVFVAMPALPALRCPPDGYVYHAFCSGSQLYFFGIDEYNMPQQEWCCMQRDNVLKILAEHRDELHQRFDVKSLALFGSVARGEATETS